MNKTKRQRLTASVLTFVMLFQIIAGIFAPVNIFNLKKNEAHAGWFDSGYGYKKEIKVDHTKVANTDQTNFPMLVSFTDPALKTVANGGKVTNISGYDIIFTNAAGSTKLDHEIEKYVPTTGEIVMWVKIPILSASTDTSIYIYYGNAAITTTQENKVGVWDDGGANNFKMVQHMNQTGAGGVGDYKDSTQYANNSTNTANQPTAGAGRIDGAESFDGSSQYLDLGNSSSLGSNVGTWDLWFKIPAPSSGNGYGMMIKADDVASYNGVMITEWQGILGVTAKNGATGVGALSKTGLADNVFHHLVYVFKSGSDHSLYIDGALAGSGSLGNFTFSSNSLRLAIHQDSYWQHLSGSLDEIRISNTTRSADWITTEYRNESNPTEFSSLGIEEVSSPAALSSFGYRKAITIDHTKVSGATNLSNFPILINLTADTSLQSHAQSTGNDILFTSSSTAWNAGTTNDKLAHEIETYTTATGSLQAWVRIPNLSPTVDTVIYMYYGNASVTSQQNKAAVWDTNTKLVQHMNQNPGGTAPQMIGSTQYANNGTSQGTMTSANTVTGQIDGANSFDGSDDGINVANNANSVDSTDKVTVSAWVNSSNYTKSFEMIAVRSSNDSGAWQLRMNGGTGTPQFCINAGSTFVSSSTGLTSGKWYYIVGTYDKTLASSNIKIYVNGAAPNTANYTASMNNAGSLYVGKRGDGWNFIGNIDEVRVSNVVRSQDWIATEYNNQSNPTEFLSLGLEEVSSPAALSSFGYRKAITIDHTKVSGASNLVNFPVLVNLPTDASLQSHAQSTGNDILFTSSSTAWNAGTTNDKLAHEIETYTTATGSLQAWVKIPQLSPTVDTVVYMYYGNASVTSQQNKAAVWDTNTKMVQHMNQNPGGTAPQMTDSTQYANNGTSGGGMTNSNSVTGQVDGATSFDGSNDYIDTGSGSSLHIIGAMTVSTWIKIPSVTGASNRGIFGKYEGSSPANNRSYNFFVSWQGADVNNPKISFAVSPDGTSASGRTATGSTVLPAATLVHVVGVYVPGSSLVVYLNGSQDGINTTSIPASVYDSSVSAKIGYQYQNDPLYFFNGNIDEVRISNVARSSDWITTEYRNESKPTEFSNLGIEEVSAPSALSTFGYRKAITIDHTKVSGATNLSNFPVLINLPTDVSLAAHAQADNDDILFTSSSVTWNTGTTNDKLAHEIETYTTATGSLQAWVRIPSLSNVTDTVIYMYYGNGSVVSQQNKTAVWDTNTKMVQHMNQAGTGAVGDYKDSTQYRNNSMNAVNQPTAGVGRIDGAEGFDGSGQYIVVPDSSTLCIGQGASATVSSWYYSTASDTNPHMLVTKRLSDYSVETDWNFFTENGYLVWGTGSSADTGAWMSITEPTRNAWHHIVGTVSSTGAQTGTKKIYVDGQLIDTKTYAVKAVANTHPLYIGKMDGNDGYMKGSIDEIEFSNIARSADWIKTEYNNQSQPTEFVNLGIEEAVAPAALSTFAYRKAITINHTKVSGVSSLTNFPVLINLPTDASLASHAKSNGDDILFTASSVAWNAGTVNDKLAHEIETYTTATGSLQAWVRIPDLSNSVDTVVYMYYGNGSITSQQNKTAVWDTNTKMVQHMNQNPGGTASQMKDSTINGNDGTSNGGMTVANSVVGKVDGATSFDGSNDFIDAGNVLNMGYSDWTMGIWFKKSVSSAAKVQGVMGKSKAGNEAGRYSLFFEDGILKGMFAPSGPVDAATSETPYLDNNWHLANLTLTRNGNMILYVDGVSKAVTNISGAVGLNSITSNNFYVGAYQDASGLSMLGGSAFPGSLDEARISNTARSASWIATEYTNQSNPTEFSTLGIEEASSPAALSSFGYRRTITIDHTKVSGDLVNFPVLVNLPADTSLAGHAQADADDILFTSSNVDWTTGTSNDKLAHEIEKYTSASGSLQSWVKIPNLSSTIDTVIYMYYGNATATSQQNKAVVWDYNARLVQHMNQTGNGAVGDYKDSTQYANNSINDANQPTATASGQIGAAESFDGVDDIINLGNSSILAPGTHDASYSFWVKSPDAEQNTALLCKRENTSPWNQACIWFADNVSWAMGVSKKIVAMNRVDDGHFLNVKSSVDIADNGWHHIYFLRGATFSRLYIDGQFNGETVNNSLNLSINSNYPLILGGLGAGAYNLNGLLDEVRFASVARSAPWISTEYNNQSIPLKSESTPAGFLSFGAEQIYRLQITGSSSQTAGNAQTITLTAKNAAGGTMTGMSENRAITLSGASAAPSGTVPTCSDYNSSDIPFGTPTTLTFVSGIATCNLKLLKAETANVTTSNTSTITDNLSVTVSPNSLNSFLVEAPASGNSGTAFATTITSQDFYHNTTRTLSGSTTLTVNSGSINPTSIGASDFTDDGQWSGNLTITNITENPSVTITATNSTVFTGADSISILGVPQSPANVSASRNTDYSMTLTWQDVSTIETGYVIERKVNAGSGFNAYSQIGTVAAGISTFTDDAATNPGNTPYPDRSYQYRVKAYNALGDSTYTEDPLIHYTTPDMPSNVFGSFVSDTNFTINYTDQADVTDTHHIRRCSNANCSGTFETDLNTFFSSPQTDTTSLYPDSRYRWQVRAEAPNITSNYESSNFEYTTPTAPIIQTTTYVSGSELTVNWQDTSAYEDGFRVEVSTDGGVYTQVTPDTNTVGANITSYAFTATPDHNYKFKVRAHIGATVHNIELFSTYSGESPAAYTTSSSPTMQAPIVSSSTGITWNWNDNSSFEEAFHLHFTIGTSADVSDIPTDATSYETTGLTPNTKYATHVHSYRSDTGESDPSAASTEIYTQSNIPSALTLAILSQKFIKADWNANANPDGTEYYLENMNTGTSSDWITASSWTSSELESGIEYSFRIKSRNHDQIETAYSSPVTIKINSSGGLPSGSTKPPTSPEGDFQILINDGNQYTKTSNVKLSFITGSDTTRMAISNSPDFSQASITPYTKEGRWGLGTDTDGTYTVYAKFYTQYGVSSKIVSDTVILDTTAPQLNLTTFKDRYLTTDSITIQGDTEPNSKVIYNLDSIRTGVIDISTDGKLNLNLGKLTAGVHNLKLITQDNLGNSSQTMQLFLNVEKPAIVPPIIPTPPTIPTTPNNPKPTSPVITPIIPVETKPSTPSNTVPPQDQTPDTTAPTPQPNINVPTTDTPDMPDATNLNPDLNTNDITPETPSSMQGDWNLISLKPFPKDITTEDIQMIVEKFPEFKDTFQDLGLNDFTASERLRNVTFNIPSLSEAMGLNPTDLTALNLPVANTPLTELSATFKKEIPSNIVFLKTKDSNIDVNSVLAFDDGTPDQKVSLLSNKSFQLILRPDQDVTSIQGYLTFKESKLSRVDETNIVEKIANLFSFNRNALAQQDIEEKLVLSEFKYQDDDQDGIWTADITTPQVSGEYELITVLNYKDIQLGAKTLRLITVVDPEGYVYENIRGQELHIKNATVSIYWFNSETKKYELWDAGKYQQQNPQVTNERGTYSFLVPPGSYYLEVKVDGYRDYQGSPFDVSVGSGVHTNIELTPIQDWQDSITWERLLLVVFGIGLFYNFYRDRKLRRKLKVKEMV